MGMFETTGRTYDYIVKLVRERGVYPLDLGQHPGGC